MSKEGVSTLSLLRPLVRWDECQRQRVAQEERARRNVQDADDGDDHHWTEACEGIAKKMFQYSEDSEVTKVSTRELKERVLSQNESSVDIVRIARQARNEGKKLCAIFIQGENVVVIACMARWEEQLKGLVVLGRHCLALKEEVEHLSEYQEILTVLMESKMKMQRTALRGVEGAGGAEDKKEALELVQTKHKLTKREGERKRQGLCKGWIASRAIGPWSGAHGQFLLWFVLILPGL